MEKLMSLDSAGAHLMSPELTEKLEKKKLSASLVGNLVDGCHAKWLADSFVLPEFIEEEKDNPKTRGTLFHSVMEHFFALPAKERTPDTIKEIVDQVLDTPENEHFKTNADALNWLKKTSVNGYYKLLKTGMIESNPSDVEIATVNGKPGLEMFVGGKLGNAKRDFVGFIDRMIVDPDDPEKIVVQDWKSGGSAHTWSGKDGDTMGLKEQRQQFIYGLLLRAMEQKVDKVQLIFPASFDKKKENHAPTVLTFDLNDEKFVKKVLSDIETADKLMDDIIETNTAEYSPSILCFWCPLVRICPANDRVKRQFMGRDKFDRAYASQPSPAELEEGILRN